MIEVVTPSLHLASLEWEDIMFCLSFRPQVLQPRVQRAMAVLRGTPLWQLLRDLYDETELPASAGAFWNAVGAHGINRLRLGAVIGAVELDAAVEVKADHTIPDGGDRMVAQLRRSFAACEPTPAREATLLDSDLARAARRNKLLYLEVWRLPGGAGRLWQFKCWHIGGLEAPLWKHLNCQFERGSKGACPFPITGSFPPLVVKP